MIYKLTTVKNSALFIMYRVHKFLLEQSAVSGFVAQTELNQFYAKGAPRASECAHMLERVGIVTRGNHPTKKGQGRPMAVFFRDIPLLKLAVEEIEAEIKARQGLTERKPSIVEPVPVAMSDTAKNLVHMTNVFSKHLNKQPEIAGLVGDV